MAALAGRSHSEIGNRTRQQVEIPGQRRGEERDRQFDLRLSELVDRVRRCYRERHLFHRRQFARVSAHKAVRLAVDARQAGDGLASTRPVGCVPVGKFVGGGPDAEVGIVGNKGNRGRPLLANSPGTAAENRGCREPLKTTAQGFPGAQKTVHHFVTLLELDGFQISNFIMCVRFLPDPNGPWQFPTEPCPG